MRVSYKWYDKAFIIPHIYVRSGSRYVIIWTVLLARRWRASLMRKLGNYANASFVKQHTVYLVRFRVSGTRCLHLDGQSQDTPQPSKLARGSVLKSTS
jgi:hypothetical protein